MNIVINNIQYGCCVCGPTVDTETRRAPRDVRGHAGETGGGEAADGEHGCRDAEDDGD